MRWYEYKMEVDDLHASDDLKAKLLALQANAAETPGAKSIAMPAPSPTPKKQKKPLRFPARRWAQLAACAAVCGVCLYGAVYAYEWKGVTLLGGGSSSNYSAAATRAAAPQAAVYSMEDTENATYGSADNGISSFSAEDGHRSADTATGGSLLTSGEAESDASTRTADSAKIIYTANLTLETRDYDTARAALDAALSDADGYMESSSEYTNTDSTRSVSLTLRVPQDSYKSFLAAAAQSGSVTYQNQQAEDITARYMDTEARLASLTAQRTRLQELQAQADTLADLLEIESSLSDVQYQIESWQSQLDWYSNQVSCCTVYITLNEVETLTPTSTSFGAKLLAALRNGWTGFVSGAQAVAVFLVGAWNDVLEAAQRIQSNFTAFSCGALTLSAGIGIFDDHYPIRLSAEETAALEEAAKHLPGKNAVALFTPERKAVRDAKGSLLVQPEQGHIYAWDTFRTKVLTEKVGCLQSFFGKDNAEHGNAMLYNLLALLREAENDRINLARYAYLLARLSPKKNAPDYKLYEQFSHNMMDWALDAVQRHQLITAIYIYVYQNRKGGDTDGRME